MFNPRLLNINYQQNPSLCQSPSSVKTQANSPSFDGLQITKLSPHFSEFRLVKFQFLSPHLAGFIHHRLLVKSIYFYHAYIFLGFFHNHPATNGYLHETSDSSTVFQGTGGSAAYPLKSWWTAAPKAETLLGCLDVRQSHFFIKNSYIMQIITIINDENTVTLLYNIEFVCIYIYIMEFIYVHKYYIIYILFIYMYIFVENGKNCKFEFIAFVELYLDAHPTNRKCWKII